MKLTHPSNVVHHLREASEQLSSAHLMAGESEGDRTNLIGPVRDAIFGLNTAVEALVAMIEEAAHIDGSASLP
jgi:hypothetical protein